jgi:hypothetical protein
MEEDIVADFPFSRSMRLPTTIANIVTAKLQTVRLRTSPIISGRFQNHISILDGITGADQTDRLGNAPFEFNMRFEGDRDGSLHCEIAVDI